VASRELDCTLAVGIVRPAAESDMVAVVSERAIELPERWKMLKRLPLLLETPSAMTMYWRKDACGFAAVDGLLDALRQVARQPARSVRVRSKS
jgi:DNA-binding transcriptional LysR family regulator